jgi:hypothetical protein
VGTEGIVLMAGSRVPHWGCDKGQKLEPQGAPFDCAQGKLRSTGETRRDLCLLPQSNT